MPKRRITKRPRLTPKRLEEAYRLNKVFDLRMRGLSEERIAKRTVVTKRQVSMDLQLLMESVGNETAEKLLTPKKVRLIPPEKKMIPIERKRKAERNRIKQWLEEHPLRIPALEKSQDHNHKKDLDNAWRNKWSEFIKKPPTEIMEEIERIDSVLEGTKDIYKANIRAAERQALVKLLKNY